MVDYFRSTYNNNEDFGIGFNGDDDVDEEIDKKLKEENYYKYHDNLQIYDPKGQPYSYFYITLMGQVESGEFLDLDGLQLHYSFVAGEDWILSSGSSQG